MTRVCALSKLSPELARGEQNNSDTWVGTSAKGVRIILLTGMRKTIGKSVNYQLIGAPD